DKLLADVIDPDLAKSIAVIEHADDNALKRDTVATVNQFFVTLAANPEEAFDYSRSSANALGLVQFIPSTYKSVVAHHPDLHLIADFESGMRDMNNALTAQVAYLDEILNALPADVRAQYAVDANSKERVQEYMTAAYNGGTVRVKKSIPFWDDLWTGDVQNKIKSLQVRHNTLAANIKTWTRQLKTASKTTKPKIQAKIAAAKKEDAGVLPELTKLRDSALRAETIGYITKYRKVVAMIDNGETAVLAMN
ncbi:MAG TPA: transglycosylase SLT domain-containing protein, partial [Patescibacteria group bacterium]|nr:transglycosylase SLT domain-containing protein [Patescibacteria group bacterium]